MTDTITVIRPNEEGFPGLQEELDPLPIHLYIILDVSPSMRTRWTQTISGLNEYLDGLRQDQKENDQPYKVSMIHFSADVEAVYNEVELDTLPTFTTKNLQPHGSGTALYDAIGPTVKAINTTEPTLIVIITDGEENSSTKWDESKVNTLLDERKKLGNYTYAYLGVAKEAWGNAVKVQAFGASACNLTANEYNAGQTFNSALLGTMQGGLVGATRSYSANMRSARLTKSALNVVNFYNQPDSTTPNDENK